jgi:hypothetical protein
MNLSRKKLDFVHRGQDMAEQDEYLQSLRHIPPDNFFDIDGMCESPKDFQPKKGWSTVGTPAAYTQVVIDTTTVAASGGSLYTIWICGLGVLSGISYWCPYCRFY